ncbi:MAG: pyrroline-5-carboxylate reductase [Cyanobacteriota bacterium]
MPSADEPRSLSCQPAGGVSPAASPSAGLGVIGLGRMAQALLLPLIAEGWVDRQAVRAVVASEASAQRLQREHGLAVGTEAAAAWRCPTVLLAVKPQQLEAVARQHPAGDAEHGPPGEPASRPLLISVLAGVRLERLERLFPGWCCVRAVPNTPTLVRCGLTGLAWGQGIDPARQVWVRELFERVGEVLECPEPQLDAFLALTSSGPAFVALVAEALADGAVAAGLPRAQAQYLTQRTLAGTAALLDQAQLTPAALKDMVASPGGTTMAGLRRLESAGVRSALLEAVLAAAERSRELA